MDIFLIDDMKQNTFYLTRGGDVVYHGRRLVTSDGRLAPHTYVTAWNPDNPEGPTVKYAVRPNGNCNGRYNKSLRAPHPADLIAEMPPTMFPALYTNSPSGEPIPSLNQIEGAFRRAAAAAYKDGSMSVQRRCLRIAEHIAGLYDIRTYASQTLDKVEVRNRAGGNGGKRAQKIVRRAAKKSSAPTSNRPPASPLIIARPMIATIINGDVSGVPVSIRPHGEGVKMVVGKTANTAGLDSAPELSKGQLEKLISSLQEVAQAM